MGLNRMRVVVALLSSSDEARPAGPLSPLVEDVVWAHARPSEGLEHLTTKCVEDGLELYFFVRATSEANALTLVQALLDRVRGSLFSHGFTLDRG
ncbi:hypothetical protein [Kitasatospora purpeofusca]|uniref:hypothetical protein n=1 Tax=Kitasatospora purpeofusca TaxID=67352 RepID=UPI003693DD82